MGYADYQASDRYAAKQSGALHGVLIQNEADPTDQFRGSTTSLNISEDYEQNPVEESGNDGVDEHVTGRMTVNGSFSMNASSRRLDRLPSRQDFLGRKYTIIEYVAKSEDPDAIGIVVCAVTGCKISGISTQNAARGIRTINVNFVGSRRYTGEQWADLTGAM